MVDVVFKAYLSSIVLSFYLLHESSVPLKPQTHQERDSNHCYQPRNRNRAPLLPPNLRNIESALLFKRSIQAQKQRKIRHEDTELKNLPYLDVGSISQHEDHEKSHHDEGTASLCEKHSGSRRWFNIERGLWERRGQDGVGVEEGHVCAAESDEGINDSEEEAVEGGDSGR